MSFIGTFSTHVVLLEETDGWHSFCNGYIWLYSVITFRRRVRVTLKPYSFLHSFKKCLLIACISIVTVLRIVDTTENNKEEEKPRRRTKKNWSSRRQRKKYFKKESVINLSNVLIGLVK